MNIPPSFELQFEGKRPCLYVTVRASELSASEAFRALGDILNEAAERHCLDVLVNCSLAEPKAHEAFQQAIRSLADMRVPGRVAFVDCTSNGHKDGQSLGPHVQLFDSVKIAENWLEERFEYEESVPPQ